MMILFRLNGQQDHRFKIKEAKRERGVSSP